MPLKGFLVLAEGSGFDTFGKILCAIIDLSNNTFNKISSLQNVSSLLTHFQSTALDRQSLLTGDRRQARHFCLAKQFCFLEALTMLTDARPRHFVLKIKLIKKKNNKNKIKLKIIIFFMYFV